MILVPIDRYLESYVIGCLQSTCLTTDKKMSSKVNRNFPNIVLGTEGNTKGIDDVDNPPLEESKILLRKSVFLHKTIW